MALYARAHTGVGQRVESTLFDAGLSLLVPHAANWFASGLPPRLLGSAHPNICPYDRFHAGGGEIFLGVANDGQYRKLCEYLGRPDLAADPRFATNGSRVEHRAAMRTVLEEALAAYEAEQLCRDLMRAGVPAGPVHSVPQAFAQAHAAHRAMVVNDDDYRGVGAPVKLSGTPARRVRKPPRFAEHAEAILTEAGYTAGEIAELRKMEIVRQRPLRR
jgi:crotonobetainyl-CoA:carnitine CoA-transferase CaiB-like acyl-CoA transferase